MTDGATVEDRRAISGLVFGHMAAQALAAAVRLGLPDRLDDGGRPAADVAADLGADPAATLRLLRALAAHGLAAETGSGVFALTERGALLRSDRPGSMAAFVEMFLDPAMVAAWARLDDSVRSGRTTFDDVFGTDFFAHLAAHPHLSRTFNASMRQASAAVAAVLPGAVDLGRFGSLTDVGGGDGTLLAAILAGHPHLRGVLFDSAAGSAESTAAVADFPGRVEVVTGDFFTAVPSGSDAYLLKSIVHDWDDDTVVTILGHVRKVVPDHGRVFVVEPVLPASVDGSMHPNIYLSDLNMLVNVGGRERTEEEFRGLFGAAGFDLVAVDPLPAPAAFSVLEAAPA
ncbi:methyltransferase [Actinomycetospora termitidis]|uniref:Methyltransferase n=1 Tax=Actinomycetospora termitidis TaxID=3053470 RepID=A0ABT7MJC2_9PSEU|nr:methyltransferase [Actinomycetospora sp. Odt1-22]MDL5160022.1 methyltransferase [Actinomycetospora sp. Odt1-22]